MDKHYIILTTANWEHAMFLDTAQYIAGRQSYGGMQATIIEVYATGVVDTSTFNGMLATIERESLPVLLALAPDIYKAKIQAVLEGL